MKNNSIGFSIAELCNPTYALFETYGISYGVRFYLYLHNNSNASTLEWQSRVEYQPGSRAADAWKLDDLRIDSSPLGTEGHFRHAGMSIEEI